MKTNRLEAFSDGVLAIIITIMVLELEAPDELTISALLPKIPIFTSYVLSFIYVGIYWNNHHHLFQITQKINGKILWANLHLLFWLSLIPFVTSWIGEHHLASIPLFFYGIVLLMSALAFSILQITIIRIGGQNHQLKKILGNRSKEKISIALYFLGIVASYFSPLAGMSCYIIVAFMWLIPNRLIEEKTT